MKKPPSHSVKHADLEMPMHEYNGSLIALLASGPVEGHQGSCLICDRAHLVTLTVVVFGIEAEEVSLVSWSLTKLELPPRVQTQ